MAVATEALERAGHREAPYPDAYSQPPRWALQAAALQRCVKLLSRDQLFATPWTVAHQAPLSMGFPTGVGCHILLQEVFQNQRSNSHLLCLLHWQADSLPLHHLGNPGSYRVRGCLPPKIWKRDIRRCKFCIRTIFSFCDSQFQNICIEIEAL